MSEPKPLSHSIEAVAADLRAGTLHGVVDVMQAWPRIVGPVLAAVTTPGSLRDGVLTIHAADPGAASAVRQRAGELGDQLRAVLGADAVRSLRVIVQRRS